MVSSLVRKIFTVFNQKKKSPWAMLEISAFEDDGRVKVAFDYNETFLQKIKAMGFQAETDEDTVQLFFTSSVLRPMSLGGDDPVQPDFHPTLSGSQNVLKQ